MNETRCPQCQAVNRVTARYCAECGAPLLAGVSRQAEASSPRASSSSGLKYEGPSAPDSPTNQMLLGRYRIIKELGRGGFGAVYSAWDTNINRKCAVKENLETTPEAHRQFSREATILANLSHPNLPRVTDHFSIPGQGQYLVMDYVEGEDLQSRLNRQGRQLFQESVEWIIQVADALAYLHSENPPVVHRDVKPANIRITPAGRAMLVDFGLVKVFNPNLKTTMGARAVTPGYAPPEQYGQGKTDGRTDIYALGATLYSLLTGLDPLESVMLAVGTRMKSVREVSPDVPEQIQMVVERSMAIDPSGRYQTAFELKDALHDCMQSLKQEPFNENASESAILVARPPDRPIVAPTVQMSETVLPQLVYPQAARPSRPSQPRKKAPWIWIGIFGAALVGLLGGLLIGGYFFFQGPEATRTPTSNRGLKSGSETRTPVSDQGEEPPGQTTPLPVVPSKNPGIYVHLASDEPDTLDPALSYTSTGGGMILNIYDSLIFFEKTDPNRFVPQLALEIPSHENGGISADDRIYRFKIRPGVKFHDGSPLTPEDVAFTFQRGILQGGSASPQWLFTEPLLGAGIYDIADLIDPTLVDDPVSLEKANAGKLKDACEKVKRAVRVEDTDVVFTLAQPWSPFLATLSTVYGSITSQEWVSQNGGWNGDCSTWQRYYGRTVGDLNQTNLGLRAMGTGPYLLENWEIGKEIILRANEDYWRREPAWEDAPTGSAKIKEVVIRLIDDFDTRLAQLQAGEADSIAIDSNLEWQNLNKLVSIECNLTDQDCKLTANPNGPLTLVKGGPSAIRSDVFFVWMINTQGGSAYVGSGQMDGYGISPDFFNNVHVRRGFAYCFNYDRYLKEYLLGEGIRTINVMLPGMLGYQPDNPYYTFDPKRCEDELRQAMFNGRSVWDTGFKMVLPYRAKSSNSKLIAEILRDEMLARNYKFKIETREISSQDYYDQRTKNLIPLFDASWLEDIHDPHNWLYPYSMGYYARFQNLPEPIRNEMEEFITRGVTANDPAQRTVIYHGFNQLYYEQAPGLLLFTSINRHYQQRWVKGWYDNPIFPGIYYYTLRKD